MNKVTPYKKILIVTYVFPPTAGAGVQRPVKFVKYMSLLGWASIILTVKNASVPVKDFELLKDIPNRIKIIRTRTFEPSYNLKQKIQKNKVTNSRLKCNIRNLLSKLLIPDAQILWWPSLIPKLIVAIINYRPDCILVTAPPFSCTIPTVFISKIFKIPVVVDFRDEWIFNRENMENASKGKIAKFTDNYFEKYVVTRCSGFTAATNSYINAIRERHPSCVEENLVVTNGYDEDDFNKIAAVKKVNSKIRITYAGTVWRATSLKIFVESLKKALSRDPSLRNRVEVNIIGRVVEEEKKYFEDFKTESVINLINYLSHKDLIDEIYKSDILLLTLTDLPGANRIIPGKAFEYIASGKQILALIPNGETEELLKECCNNKAIIRPNDKQEIINYLLNIKSVYHSRMENTGVAKYSRLAQTRKLLVFIESLISRGH
jgi:glycosyltransferase involved in cell wall biosynthesis